MDGENVVVASGKDISKGWTPEEDELIARYHQSGGMTRKSAVAKMQLRKSKGVSVADQLAELKNAAPVQAQATPAVAPVENQAAAMPKEAVVRTKKVAKEKKAKKPRGEKKSGKQLYAEREAAGMCVSCGARKAMKGHKECAYDVLRTRESTKARKAKQPWSIENFKRTNACKHALEHNTLLEEK